jgi:cell division protein FtsL
MTAIILSLVMFSLIVISLCMAYNYNVELRKQDQRISKGTCFLKDLQKKGENE